MPEAIEGEITLLLGRWERGEPAAMEALAPLVYGQVRAIAEALLRDERPGHTLQPTAVVNEVFLDLLRLRRLAMRDARTRTRVCGWEWVVVQGILRSVGVRARQWRGRSPPCAGPDSRAGAR